MKREVTFILLLLLTVSTSYGQQVNDTTEFALVDKLIDILTVNSKNEDFSMVFYPTGDYSEQTGLSVGVMPILTWKRDKEGEYFRPTSLIPSLEISTKGMYDADLSLILFGLGRWNIFASGFFTYTPNTYYGINQTQPQDSSAYFNKIFGAIGEMSYALNPKWFAGLRFDVQYNDFDKIEGDALNESVNGYEGGFTPGLGPVLKYDTRDDIIYPSKGSFITTAFVYYPGQYEFNHFFVDARYFIPLEEDKKILALNYLYHNKSGNVPFYQLNQLGGKNRLRSIGQPNRFIDEQMMLFQAEYRQEIWWRIGMTAFFGVGNVFGEIPFTQDMKYGGGLGLRFRLVDEINLNFRLDIGFGNYQQQGTWITSREAF